MATAEKKMSKQKKATPLMGQYNEIKAKYPDAILLFRVGDFYETFGQDAIITAEIAGIVLTKRGAGSTSEIELAGFPHHALDTYLPKMVKAGHRVAICDQLEDPKMTKTIVKRGVTELITPGVAHNDKLLDHKSNNFLASVYLDKKEAGVSFLDISTGEYLVAEGSYNYIDKLLQSFQPSEVIFSKTKQKVFIETFGDQHYTYAIDDWVYAKDYCEEKLLNHFGTKSLKGFGIENLNLGVIAAGAILHYLADTEHSNLNHISAISRIDESNYVWLDKFSIRNLELLNCQYDQGKALVDVLDYTISPMGSRLLKRWIILPLKDKTTIDERLDVVETFIKDRALSDDLVQHVKLIGDLERLISKIPLGKVSPREVAQLKRALTALAPIKELCLLNKNTALKKIGDQINLCVKAKERIEKELVEEPAIQIGKGNIISEGVSKELDDLKAITRNGKAYLVEIQEREGKNTGIPSLKIKFNNVFGYYLEVTNTHKDKVPANWIRKQTLVNAERYITEELKEYEEKILGAEEKINAIESKLFNELVGFLSDYIQPIQFNALLVAKLDCYINFANLAIKHQYCKPVIEDHFDLKIEAGRHPVIEQQLPLEENYVDNDIFLSNDSQQIIIITGPNMSGKSALLRQTALIVLMAQMGCYVPARSANIGIIDKIFTRVGASDNISSGESTFMVEMNETASIVNNISDRSLILLDEIGRGTSTFDGISIAWSLAEFLHNNRHAKPKTLFATHYHELNELQNKLERIKNFHVSTKELNNKVVFLRKLVEGGSEHSFGIHVAKMAGMPKEIVKRANQILVELESKKISNKGKTVMPVPPSGDYQLSFFQMDDPKHKKMKELFDALDINTLTPVEALMKLNDIKEMLDA